MCIEYTNFWFENLFKLTFQLCIYFKNMKILQKTFRLAMKKYYLKLLGVIFLNLGPVLADCTEEQDQNTRNTIQWFIRNIFNFFITKSIFFLHFFKYWFKNSLKRRIFRFK